MVPRQFRTTAGKEEWHFSLSIHGLNVMCGQRQLPEKLL